MEQINARGESVTLIHYTFHAGGRDDNWRVACMPNMTELHRTPYHPNYQRSNDVRAVTCPACRATALFKGAAGALATHLEESARAK